MPPVAVVVFWLRQLPFFSPAAEAAFGFILSRGRFQCHRCSLIFIIFTIHARAKARRRRRRRRNKVACAGALKEESRFQSPACVTDNNAGARISRRGGGSLACQGDNGCTSYCVPCCSCISVNIRSHSRSYSAGFVIFFFFFLRDVYLGKLILL